MKENKTYYKKKIYFVLFAMTLVFGFQSLYEYYSVSIENPFLRLSNVLFGILKMFLFTPPISPDDSPGIIYEIAKWMAPILTSAFVFTKISNTLLHLKNIVINKFSRNHILIFEKSLMSETLITNLMNEKTPYKISLISRQFIDDNLKAKYEKKGIATYQIDFEKSGKNEIRELLNTVNINKVKYMFFCSEADLVNYALYANVIKRIKPKRNITCYVKCESKTVSSYIEDVITRAREEAEVLKKIDTVHFDQRDLTVRMLMSDKCVLKSLKSSLNDLSQMDNMISLEKIGESIRNMHILILGVNELTEVLLKHIANDMTLCLKANTKVSIMDKAADSKMAAILDKNEGLKNALNLKAIDIGSSRNSLQEGLTKIKNEGDLSLIFMMDEDVVKSLKYLKTLTGYFGSLPKIIRNVSNIDLSYVLPKNSDNILVFGDVSQIMTSDIMIRESLDERAKTFNDSYNKAVEMSGMGSGSSWNELSYVKRTSSRLSATHARVKEEILRKIFFDNSDDEIRNYLSKKFEEFGALQDIMQQDWEEFKIRFRGYLSDNPILDFLSRLEHKRWCNSYYAMNFVYGENKDENLKTHPCLIDDWDIIIGDKFDICHPEYDLLSVFTLFKTEK
ncbi:hypothetical protein [Catonella massiliensis]|uniref:Ryanodine receptor Ryr domain-containing protein n=1 Tax=Catonella massiliensis TaxID=2799636 RepID=A0ABS1IYE2_9FIRM|nr:hypothetical protein [Catonella massiliensis]MBK5896914.1 hypothetical protein [Catonella massiliensis]